MTQPESEMVLISKLYDLVLWTGQHVAWFPRSHKFTSAKLGVFPPHSREEG